MGESIKKGLAISMIVLIAIIAVLWIYRQIYLARFHDKMHQLAENGKMEDISYLLSSDPIHRPRIDERDKYGYTALHWAAQKGHLEIVKLLLKNGASLELKSFDNGWTPLHCAVSENRIEVLKFLLKQGADPNTRGTHNKTPLFIACYKGYLATVRILVAAGINVNSTDDSNKTAVMRWGDHNFKIYKLLLEAGSDLNIQDSIIKDSILHRLVNSRDTIEEPIEYFKLYFQHGGKPNPVNTLKKTPLDDLIDSEKKTALDDDLEKLLRSCGAKTFQELKADGQVPNE